jgi:hypothetical protein
MGTDKVSPFIQLVTGIDNQTHDVVRWMGLLGSLFMIFYQGYSLIVNKVFNPQEFAIGYSSLLAGIGIGVRLKASSEPQIS